MNYLLYRLFTLNVAVTYLLNNVQVEIVNNLVNCMPNRIDECLLNRGNFTSFSLLFTFFHVLIEFEILVLNFI